jgi:NAD(P)-dependent dehydrogenase (short-subunit alcohol dehydrogenase family)
MTETSPNFSAGMFDEKPLAGQHAVITGGSRGIGAAISNYLARLGANVSLTGRTQETLESQANQLATKYGVKVCTATGDMAVEADVVAAFDGAVKALGPVSVLVNNAGIGESAPFHRMEVDFWQKIIGLNLTGTFLTTKQVYGSMREQKYGRIINVASIVGLTGFAYIAAYAASKHGVIGMTRSLALEAAKSGITVNAICPGYTDTDLVAAAVDNIVDKTGRSTAEAVDDLASTSPLGRLIDPNEVAETAAWLSLPSSAAITGQSIVVAGGAVLN